MNVFPVLAVDDFSVERGYRSSLNYTLSDVPQEDVLGYKAKQTWSINSNAEDTSEFEASSVGPYSTWESLIGASKANTDTSVARNSDGRLEVFVVSTDNQLWHRWQTSPGSSTWSAWSSLGGTIAGSPAVTINSDGRLEVFVVGANGNALYHKWQTSPGSSTSWSSYVSLGGTITGIPAVTRNSDGRLEVFVVGANGNALYHKWQTAPGSSTWSAWDSLGGTIVSNPAIGRNSDGRLEVFVVSTDNQLWHRWQTSTGSSTWSAWSSLGGTIAGSPAVTINSDGRIEVFVVGANGNALYHKWQTSPGSSTSWSNYVSLGGTITGNPEVTRNSDGRLEVFVVGANGNALYHRWQTAPGSSTWSAWESLGGTISSNPTMGRNSDGRLEVFAVAADNAVWHKWQVESDGILPVLKDPNLAVEHFTDGLSSPTSMAFLDDDNILVLEKSGAVRLVRDGVLQIQPVLQVPINTQSERGLLGIAASGSNVFLYYTEQIQPSGSDPRNRVYKYSWNGQNLVNPVLLLDLPGVPGPNHDGGKLLIGQDNFLYAIIGDLNRNGKLQNFAIGPNPDDTSVILRVSPNDGSPAPGNPLSSDPSNPLSKYFAYGIRNSFGLDYDPVTGRIWDTENGPNLFDEINLVNSGFNSGWERVMGPIALSGMTTADLVNFPGSHYADPLLNWRQPIGITDLEFISSQQLGPSYQNNLFVGDINNGNLYFLTLNPARDGFILNQPGLSDLIVDNTQELASITLGNGFSGITDIQTGPDGLMYVLSFGSGKIFRIAQSP
jgi:aldose sugar dehydrogenase